MNKKNEQKKMYEMKPLEEMDLIDDFLFTEVMADNENGQKACRVILETILKRKIGSIRFDYQKVVPGISEGSHGIRLDTFIREELLPEDGDIPEINIYDIEPDRKENKKNGLPKRARYYNSLLDVQLLQTGVDYERMPELITIFILSYDPFGANAMYYEAGNVIKTHPQIEYSDGVRRIILYIGGDLPENADEDDKRIKNLLKYIGRSKEENIIDEATGELDRIVKTTKSKKDVGIRYMKSWERERELREAGREEERANTERERKRADDAEIRAVKAEKSTINAEARADKAEKSAINAEARADKAEAELARYIAEYGKLH